MDKQRTVAYSTRLRIQLILLSIRIALDLLVSFAMSGTRHPGPAATGPCPRLRDARRDRAGLSVLHTRAPAGCSTLDATTRAEANGWCWWRVATRSSHPGKGKGKQSRPARERSRSMPTLGPSPTPTGLERDVSACRRSVTCRVVVTSVPLPPGVLHCDYGGAERCGGRLYLLARADDAVGEIRSRVTTTRGAGGQEVPCRAERKERERGGVQSVSPAASAYPRRVVHVPVRAHAGGDGGWLAPRRQRLGTHGS